MNKPIAAVAFLLALLAAPLADAHRMWMLPSKTVLSVGQTITVDAATATDPFIKDHRPLDLAQLQITGPDGQRVEPINPVAATLHSSFDLKLEQAGTYKLAFVRDSTGASWDDQGKRGRWPPRGEAYSAEGLAKALPKTATDVKVTRMLGRLESFVTAGAPNRTALVAPVEGLAMLPVTAFNDLYADEPATFRFVLDGKPAADLGVELIADGIRYRNAADAMELKTDAKGELTIRWPRAGMYWLGANLEDRRGSATAPYRRLSYSAVLEVLSP